MGSFLGFAGMLARIASEIPEMEHRALEEAAMLVEKTAKDALGTYEFGWPPLAESTIAQKATGDSPLLETGVLRDSISHKIVGHAAYIGTDEKKAVFLELGTSKMPPRSFLMESAHRKSREIEEIVKRHVKATLVLR